MVVARRLLNQKRELSLRAVAAEMGVSAPALYRYVASVNQLVTMVAAEILGDATREIRREAAPYEAEPISQIAVGAVAFRHWALTHPEEFRVVFTTTHGFERDERDDLVERRHQADTNFMGLFASIFARAIDDFRVRVPEEEELGETLVTALSTPPEWMQHLPADTPLGVQWLFQLDFTKLYGCICLEVFGFVQQPLIDTGSLFIAALREIGFSMALGETVERATRAAQAEVAHLLERDGLVPASGLAAGGAGAS